MSWQCSAVTNSGLIDNMIRNKIIRTEVVRDAFTAIDRKWFVPHSMLPHAYEDRPLPIGHNVTISAPHMHAAMAELIVKSMLPEGTYDAVTAPTSSKVSSEEKEALFKTLKGKRVLDVGSGSGFLTALMAHIVGPTGTVHGIEHVPELVSASSRVIHENCPSIMNLDPKTNGNHFRITVGDGRVEPFPEGFLSHYDAIHVGAAAPYRAPQALLDRIAPSGCLVIPIDDDLHVIRRAADGKTMSDTIAMGVRFVPLTDLKMQLS